MHDIVFQDQVNRAKPAINKMAYLNISRRWSSACGEQSANKLNEMTKKKTVTKTKNKETRDAKKMAKLGTFNQFYMVLNTANHPQRFNGVLIVLR